MESMEGCSSNGRKAKNVDVLPEHLIFLDKSRASRQLGGDAGISWCAWSIYFGRRRFLRKHTSFGIDMINHIKALMSLADRFLDQAVEDMEAVDRGEEEPEIDENDDEQTAASTAA